AELMCQKWGLTRDELERYAFESHQRAAKAVANGYFKDQITPVNGVEDDEGPRPDTTLEKMAGLKTLKEDGQITAATSSQISDGSGAVLIASERAVHEHGLTPRARIHQLALMGDDPVYMLTAPIPATRRALEKAGLAMDDIDVTEINEAFAPVPMAWIKELGADPARVNPNGGAIALGHPLGATGAILMTKLLHELERTGGRYGLQTMCEGGGQANVTIIERL
ncbi:MAG: acetyl-CoA acetyltransferase, partial [Nonomuraea muscovyensis]|nr:acetyl-CoA acetyltransferase [Nonomuraea muscovyensis]